VQTHHDDTCCGFTSISFRQLNTGPSDGNRRRSQAPGLASRLQQGFIASQGSCCVNERYAWCYSPIEWFRFHVFTKIRQYPSRSSTQKGSVLEIISNYRCQLMGLFFFLERIDKPNSCECKFMPKGGILRRTDWHWLFPIRAFTPRVIPYGHLWPKSVAEDPLKRCAQGWPATSSRWPAKQEVSARDMWDWLLSLVKILPNSWHNWISSIRLTTGPGRNAVMDLPACETFPPSTHVLAPAMWGEEAIYTWRDAPCVTLPPAPCQLRIPTIPPRSKWPLLLCTAQSW